MGTSSGSICSRETFSNGGSQLTTGWGTRRVCGNRVIFRINKHKSSVSSSWLRRCPPSAEWWPSTTHGSRLYRRPEGRTAATITCLEGAKGVAPVGRSIGPWWRVPRQFDDTRIIARTVEYIIRSPTFDDSYPRLWLHCVVEWLARERSETGHPRHRTWLPIQLIFEGWNINE